MFRARRDARRRRAAARPRPGSESRSDTGEISVRVIDDDRLAGDLERWQRLVQSVLDAENVVGPGEATLVFVEAVAISQLNRLHMGRDEPTDVLSFPIDGAEPVMSGEHRVVGDVVVCPEVAAVNAPDHAGTLDDELALLICHGVLHLVGHDHAEPSDRDQMWSREREIMAASWSPLTQDPWASVS